MTAASELFGRSCLLQFEAGEMALMQCRSTGRLDDARTSIRMMPFLCSKSTVFWQ